ncbi:MAG: pyruvate kinase [Spirochaetia bacterium]|nr:pyruvate kinase [Spirochaetia bacterium]
MSTVKNLPLNKKTKIICTIGPASSSKIMIKKLVEAGMNIARINFSHGDHATHEKTYKHIREIEKSIGRPIGILADLQGPKIRTTALKVPPFILKPGDEILINNNVRHLGDRNELGCTYPFIVDDVQINEKLLIDDGKLSFRVKEKQKDRILLQTIHGGIVSGYKGINLPGTKITSPALTPKDLKDLKLAKKLGSDFVALSFVRSAKDIELIKTHLKGTFIDIIAKIERPEAIENIDEIIEAADGIMIARGDLGVELETEMVPVIQKKIIKKTNMYGKVVITATQMMESMLENPRPTRADASDIANAVLDGTDAVMLSAETATGKFPVEAVSIMSKIIHEAEEIYQPTYVRFAELPFQDDEIALGTAAANITDLIKAKAIVTFTRSGYSGRLASRFRPRADIYSFTPFDITARKMAMLRGVISHVMPTTTSYWELMEYANLTLKKKYHFKANDKIIILSAAPGSKSPVTTLLQIYKIK